MECDNQPKGKICEQDPAADTKVDKGSSVTVKISSGAPKVAVIDVRSLEFAKAEADLKAKGFEVQKKTVESDRPAGIVLEQDPKSGTEAEKGSTVTLTVAKEFSKGTVPDLTGKNQAQAAKALQDAKLKLGSVTEEDAPPARRRRRSSSSSTSRARPWTRTPRSTSPSPRSRWPRSPCRR